MTGYTWTSPVFLSTPQRRRGQAVAAVATARKVAVIVWHLLAKAEDYA